MASPSSHAQPATLLRLATGWVSRYRLATRLLVILMVVSGLGLVGMSTAVWALTHNQIYERVDADLRRSLDSWALNPDTRMINTTLPSEYMLLSLIHI